MSKPAFGFYKDVKYKAGEIADLLGISVVALRNYEKLGLISPARDEQNNYRQFDAIAFNMLRRARSYMGLGCSMREAVSLIQNCTVSDLPQIFQDKAAALEKQIEHDQHVLDFLRQRSEHLERICVSNGECFIENSPGVYAILYRRGLEMTTDPKLRRLVREWNEMYPFVDAVGYYLCSCFTGGKVEYWHGLCVEERFAKYLGIQENEYIHYYPPRKSVYAFKTCDYKPDIFGRVFSFTHVSEWIDARGLKVAGNAIGRAIHAEKSTGKYIHNMEIWVPIE